MKNRDALSFFQKLAEDNTQGPKSVKLANSSDFSDLDAEFIIKYANVNSCILDLGSGTGLIINKIYKKVKHITVLEPFKAFTDFITPSDNIRIINETLLDFENTENMQFDLITIFAVMHYFNVEEASKIYEKYFKYLIKNGKLIIKNQFGVEEDVIVEGFSEEQNSNYYAEYRHIEKEIKILEGIGFKNTEIVDIYPPECNRWPNTHFYAIIAEKHN